MREPPAGWRRARLDQIGQVRLGRQRSPKNHTGDQMRPYLRAANITWGGLDMSDVKEMNFSAGEVAVYELRPGDILLSEASGSAKEVGKPAVWRGEYDGPICFQNTLLRVRPMEGVLTEFLHLRLLLECLSGGFARSSRGVGIHHLGAAKLAALEIDLPPLDEQRQIVELLDDHLSRLDAAQNFLQASSARILGLRLGVLLRALSRFRDSGRTFLPMGQVTDTALGKMLDRKRIVGTPTPYLRNINVRWGQVDTTDVKTVPLSEAERQSLALRPGDLLVCEGGEPGRCAVWLGSDELMAFQKALHRVRVRPGVLLPEFVAAMLEVSVRTGAARSLLTGTTIKHLPQERLRELAIPVPELHEQAHLIAELREIEEESARLRRAIKLAEARGHSLRRALLDTAFSGRLTARSFGTEIVEELAAQERVLA